MTCIRSNSLFAACGRRFTAARAHVARLAAGVVLAASAIGTASAADMPDFLRGTLEPVWPAATYMNWSGLYFGAQAGYSTMNTDFGAAVRDWVAFNLRNTTLEANHHPEDWAVMPSVNGNSAQYGFFLGYNMQWDQLVLGVDVAYNRMSSMRTSAADGLTRVVTDPNDTVSIYAQSSMQLVDYATLRGRVGYAFGQFLPYGILGVAVGRFNYSISAVMQVSGSDTFGPVTMTENKSDAIAAGFVTGLGLDVALMPNVFLRGEWEFVAFGELSGILNTMNTGRVGIAVKF